MLLLLSLSLLLPLAAAGAPGACGAEHMPGDVSVSRGKRDRERRYWESVTSLRQMIFGMKMQRRES